MAEVSRDDKVCVVTREDELVALAPRLSRSDVIALDIESNGIFAYRARLCVLQLATRDEVVLIDALTTPLTALTALLGENGPLKIIHDVAFDARILADTGITLGNVRDTSLAARMLGRTATGLSSLLAEVGVTLDKKMQKHDWSKRPLTREALVYLAADVVHLHALADRLWTEVDARGIASEVDEETRYRLGTAREGTTDPRPAWLRLKGIERAPLDHVPILRHLTDLRETRARELDVPPFKIFTPDVLFAIAAAKPKNLADLARIRGISSSGPSASLANAVLRAVEKGLAEAAPSPEDLALLSPPRPPASMIRARRDRERSLSRWRKAEAARRSVDEQVVLPGHCLQDLAEIDEPTELAIAAVPGIGAFRVARDGAALLSALTTPPPGESA